MISTYRSRTSRYRPVVGDMRLSVASYMIGEHMQLEAITCCFTKEALIGSYSLLGNKPVISQVHSYNILVISALPQLHLRLM